MELTKNQQQVIDLVKEMSAVELNGLVKALEEEFGVTAAAMVVAGGAAGGAAADAGAAGGSDSVNVELTEAGQQKIAVIKVVKEVGIVDSNNIVVCIGKVVTIILLSILKPVIPSPIFVVQFSEMVNNFNS